MTHVVKKPATSSQRLKQLGQYASSPGHRGLAVTQNSPFSSLVVTVATASTYGVYPRTDGQAELIWVVGYSTDRDGVQTSKVTLVTVFLSGSFGGDCDDCYRRVCCSVLRVSTVDPTPLSERY